jgi:hypothetical protein
LDLDNGQVKRHLMGSSAVTGVSAAFYWAVVSFANGRVIGNKFGTDIAWAFQNASPFSQAAVINGVVFLTSSDSTLRAFTIPGTQIP